MISGGLHEWVNARICTLDCSRLGCWAASPAYSTVFSPVLLQSNPVQRSSKRSAEQVRGAKRFFTWGKPVVVDFGRNPCPRGGTFGEVLGSPKRKRLKTAWPSHGLRCDPASLLDELDWAGHIERADSDEPIQRAAF